MFRYHKIRNFDNYAANHSSKVYEPEFLVQAPKQRDQSSSLKLIYIFLSFLCVTPSFTISFNQKACSLRFLKQLSWSVHDVFKLPLTQKLKRKETPWKKEAIQNGYLVIFLKCSFRNKVQSKRKITLFKKTACSQPRLVKHYRKGLDKISFVYEQFFMLG